MTVTEWFDPYSDKHLAAYRCLSETGTWPRGFIPKYVSFPVGWHFQLTLKMTDCWLKYRDTLKKVRTP